MHDLKGFIIIAVFLKDFPKKYLKWGSEMTIFETGLYRHASISASIKQPSVRHVIDVPLSMRVTSGA